MSEKDESGAISTTHVFNSISEHEAREARSAFESGGILALRSYLQKLSEQWRHVNVNIAVIGNSGAGKTTLINAIRGLKARDPGAGRTGVVETTKDVTPYPHPKNPKMLLWDLPGVGTPNYPRDNYLNQIQIQNFDFFLIITQARFTENDKWIAEKIRESSRDFYFIRTKIAVDMFNDREDNGDDHDPEKVLADIRTDIKQNLGDSYSEDAVFLIDSQRRGFQFDVMVAKLIDDFPSLKREAIILTMGAFSEAIVEKKVAVLRKRAVWFALASGLGGAIPVPGISLVIDSTIFATEVDSYRRQLGIDRESLEKAAVVNKLDIECVKNAAGRWGSMELSKIAVQAFLANVKSGAANAHAAVEQFKHYLPAIGSLVGAPVSFGTTLYVLDNALTEMKVAAIKVLQITSARKQD